MAVIVAPNLTIAQDGEACLDAIKKLNDVKAQYRASAQRRSDASDKDDCKSKLKELREGVRLTRLSLTHNRLVATACINNTVTGGGTDEEFNKRVAQLEQRIKSDEPDCTNEEQEKQAKEEHAIKERAAKQKADGEAKAKQDAEARSAEEAEKQQAKKDETSRPSDPQQCIAERLSAMKLGYIDYHYSNSCEVAIGFDIDDCDAGPNFEIQCKVKRMAVPAKSDTIGSNYKTPPNSRNFR